MTKAITIDSITDNGTATSRGRKSKNKGTAIRDSPKPKIDLIREAKKLMVRIKVIVKIIFSGRMTFFPLDNL